MRSKEYSRRYKSFANAFKTKIKGEAVMAILISHWHCILPVVGIIIAAFLLRDKSSDNEKNDDNRLNSQLNSYEERK